MNSNFVGPDYEDLYRKAAHYVDKILKGTKPADLSVQQAAEHETVSVRDFCSSIETDRTENSIEGPHYLVPRACPSWNHISPPNSCRE